MIEHNGKIYSAREIPLEAGFAFIQGDGSVDMAGMMMAAILIDGEPAAEGEVPMKIGMKLMPEIMELNGLDGEEEGND